MRVPVLAGQLVQATGTMAVGLVNRDESQATHTTVDWQVCFRPAEETGSPILFEASQYLNSRMADGTNVSHTSSYTIASLPTREYDMRNQGPAPPDFNDYVNGSVLVIG